MFSTNAKVEHARQKLHVLQDEIQLFAQAQFDSVSRHVNVDAGEQFWIFNGTSVTPPEWSLEIGDIINNFRAGLDHLIWQLVVANGETPGRHNSFPIVESEIKLQAAMKSCLSGVHPAAQAIIEGFKPYKSGNLHLWRLDSLCNIDKHRYLHTSMLHVGDVPRINGGSDHMQVVHRLISMNKVIFNVGPVEKGAKLLIIPDSQVNVNFNPTLHIAFTDRQPDITDLYVSQTMLLILTSIDEVFEALNPHL